jgi:hypothetical protein
MLIRRCAWHRQHFGYAVILGIAEWGGHGVAYTDGICRNCATLERRRLVVGDSATAAAARGLRRRAVSRAFAVVFTAGLASALLSGDPGPRHDANGGERPAVASVATAGLVSVPRLAVEHTTAPPSARPASPPVATAARDRATPPGTFRLAGERAQSFHQLARAADVAAPLASDQALATVTSPTAPTSVSPRPSLGVLAALRSVFDPPSDDSSAVVVALAAAPRREERSEAP